MKSRRRGRLAPVTSTTCGRAASTRRAAIVQLPAGRSVKMTRIFRESTSSRSACSISAAPNPELDIARKSSPRPVICSTALTNPKARSPCAATIATGVPSLIIFLEILANRGGLGGLHPLHEALVERFGGIHAAVAQEVVHRDHFGDDSDVLAGIEWNEDLRQLHAEDGRRGAIESRPIDGGRFVPLLELYHHFDSLLLADGADAEDRLHIDQADAANLHVVPGEIMATADENVISAPRRDDEVVGHETVSALDEIEHALRLSDAALPDEEQADAKHVGERSVNRRERRELLGDDRLDPRVELGRLQLGPKNRNSRLPRDLRELGGQSLTLRHEQAGDGKGEELLQHLTPA